MLGNWKGPLLRLSALLILLILFFGRINAQDAPDISDEEKSGYISLIYKICPDADILSIERTEDKYIEVDYLCNGRIYEAGIINNEIFYKESPIKLSEEFFAKIRKHIHRKYPDWLLDEISEISTKDTSFIKVEILKDGVEKNLFYSLQGKKYHPGTIVSSDNWDLEKLSANKLFRQADYQYLNPEDVYELPELLKEISGIICNGQSNVFCVQDELGAVFEYSLPDEEISNIYRFTDVGDFEDIALKGDTMFIMRSDGNIFSFNYHKKEHISRNIISINALDIESLFYDKTNNRFLVVSKDPLANLDESLRRVYYFQNNEYHNLTAIMDIDINEINDYLNKNYRNAEVKNTRFNPSAIALHPITGDIYVLSATDGLIAIYSGATLKAVYPLPTEIYYKPEGLAFYANGDMLISSEGDKKGLISGSIMMLKYKGN